MVKTIAFTVLLTLITTGLFAQSRKKEPQGLQFGFKAGAAYSKIKDLDLVLVSEDIYKNYSFKNQYSWGATAGVFINYHFDESIFALYSELCYSRLGSTLKYTDIKNFWYNMTLRYEFITWDLFYKAYIWKGLYVGIGPRIGLNVTPDALYYKSNGEDLYLFTDQDEQKGLRSVLKGRSNFSGGIGAGWELHNGLSIDFRYYHGFSDVLETLVNDYNFIETKNASRTFQCTIGYALPYNLKFNK
jgi:hypothetical protein